MSLTFKELVYSVWDREDHSALIHFDDSHILLLKPYVRSKNINLILSALKALSSQPCHWRNCTLFREQREKIRCSRRHHSHRERSGICKGRRGLFICSFHKPLAKQLLTDTLNKEDEAIAKEVWEK